MQDALARARELFDDVQLIGVRMPRVVDPRRLVEADDVDDERVGFPPADRMPQIGRVEIVALRVRAAVHVDLAPDVRRALERQDDALLLRQLKDLHRVRRRHQTRPAGRQTVALGVVLRFVGHVIVVDRRRPLHERHERLELRSVFLHVVADEADAAARRWQIAAARGPIDPETHVPDPRDVPHALLGADAPEVRRAVGEARRRPGDRRRAALREEDRRSRHDHCRDECASHADSSCLDVRRVTTSTTSAADRGPADPKCERSPSCALHC